MYTENMYHFTIAHHFTRVHSVKTQVFHHINSFPDVKNHEASGVGELTRPLESIISAANTAPPQRGHPWPGDALMVVVSVRDQSWVGTFELAIGHRRQCQPWYPSSLFATIILDETSVIKYLIYDYKLVNIPKMA